MNGGCVLENVPSCKKGDLIFCAYIYYTEMTVRQQQKALLLLFYLCVPSTSTSIHM